VSAHVQKRARDRLGVELTRAAEAGIVSAGQAKETAAAMEEARAGQS
jgi:hypothetical protein